ncbi:MAG TPA: glycosyltransferase [Candidatus Acidoferrum sp.]
MPSVPVVLAALSLAIWLYLALARGKFWSLQEFDDDQSTPASLENWPTVTAIIPARNEAETIAQTVASLAQQNYPGKFSIVVVDDHSEDATAQLGQTSAQESAQKSPAAKTEVTILSAPPLQPNWTGKLSALNHGIQHADQSQTPPSYLWFTDADIVHAPDTLTRLITRAEQNNLDLTSLMVLLRAQTLPERFLIPPFLFFFLKLYPPSKIANPKSQTAGAAGGCILLRRTALDRIGGLTAIRGEVIDDCALARAIKRRRDLSPNAVPRKTALPKATSVGAARTNTASTPKIWMGVTRQSHSLRAYTTFSEIRDMIARTAFTQLHYSPLLLAGTLLGLAITYVAPIALLFAHDTATRLTALLTWLIMSLLFLPTVRYYSVSTHWAASLPLAALLYAAATFLSAIRYWLNRGAQWKGRSQAARRL